MAHYSTSDLTAIESMTRAFTENMAIENLDYQAEELTKAAFSFNVARTGQPIKGYLGKRVQCAQRSFEIAAEVARRFGIAEERIAAAFPVYSLRAS